MTCPRLTLFEKQILLRALKNFVEDGPETEDKAAARLHKSVDNIERKLRLNHRRRASLSTAKHSGDE